MIIILKNIILNFLLFSSLVINNYDSENIYNQDWSKNICKKYFSYPTNLINYSISGSSVIEFTVNNNGKIENLNFIKSLGYPFEQSIIEGLNDFISEKLNSNKKQANKKYRLKIKFEN